MKKKNSRLGDCVVSNVGCIRWNLEPIPCLGIETGDMLDTVTFALVEKICALTGDDLSDINLQCLIDKFDIDEPTEYTVKQLLQLAFDNQCSIYDLIQEVRSLITSENETLTLDLKCLAQYDSFGNQLPYTEQTVLQSLITKVCLFDGQLATLNGNIVETNIRIDNLPAPYTEPNITTCLSGTPKTTSQTVVIMASDYCNYKTKIGDISAIDLAIGSQPSVVDVTDPLFANPDLIISPATLADSDTNQWVFIESLLTRIKALEACACAVTCKDITIGFIVQFEDDNTVTLRFTSGAGSNIPSEFEDCGSILTITGSSGVTSAPINLSLIGDGIAQDAELVGIDISSFEAGETLSFDIEAELCSSKTNTNCSKCVSKTVKNTSGCCTITATDEVTIIYEVCGGL